VDVQLIEGMASKRLVAAGRSISRDLKVGVKSLLVLKFIHSFKSSDIDQSIDCSIW
jgi:hypothetical protein